MTIKDFKAGEEAYLIRFNEKNSLQCRVEKVGRKYVTVKFDEYLEQFYQGSEKDDFLIENIYRGGADLLFPTEKAAFDYIDRRRIYDKLMPLFRYPSGYFKFAVEQLRAIEKILNLSD